MEKFYPTLSDQFAALLRAIAGEKVAIIGHARPDGDCIGAQVALARVLATRGFDAICVNPDPIPRRLLFLARGMRFYRTDEILKTTDERAPIFVDCADHARGGERLKVRYAHPVGVIDHHLSNLGYGEFNLVDSASAATCEILAGVCFDHGLEVDAQAAQALFTGIMTDDPLHQTQSKTQPPLGSAAIAAEQPVPDSGHFVLGYPHAGIGDAQLDAAAGACGDKIDASSLRCVLDGIVDKVRHHLPHTVVIRPEPQMRRRFGGQGQGFRVCDISI